MNGFVIQRSDGGLPVFFSARQGLNLGAAGQGWVNTPGEALAFHSTEDAQEFIDIYLPHVGVFCTPVPRHEKAA